MTPIVTINGINRSAAHTTNRLATALQARGLHVQHLTYPTRRWWETRNRRNQYMDALGMLRQLPARPVHVVAHSWGCLLTARMMELGGTGIFRNVFLFAPALDRDWVFPLEAFSRLHVIYHEQDRAVLAARLMFLGWHPWGDMGRTGYRGEDPRVVNVQDTTKRPAFWRRMHSHYFDARGCERWSRFILDRIREE